MPAPRKLRPRRLAPECVGVFGAGALGLLSGACAPESYPAWHPLQLVVLDTLQTGGDGISQGRSALDFIPQSSESIFQHALVHIIKGIAGCAIGGLCLDFVGD